MVWKNVSAETDEWLRKTVQMTRLKGHGSGKTATGKNRVPQGLMSGLLFITLTNSLQDRTQEHLQTPGCIQLP
jgi:hypothetical protein